MNIWQEGSKAFVENSAARAMIWIMFIAMGSFFIIAVTSLVGGKAKMAGTFISILGGVACLSVFIVEVVKLINLVGKTLGF